MNFSQNVHVLDTRHLPGLQYDARNALRYVVLFRKLRSANDAKIA